jgi:RNA polymerase sigma-70 factor (ECF subfamily)
MIDYPIQFLRGNPAASKELAPSLSICPSWIDIFLFSLKTQDAVPAGDYSDCSDIRHAQNGDQDAFRRIMERYQPHVSKLLWRFTRDKNSHEELVQESFVQAYLSLHSYKAQAPFEHWLSRIATRAGYRFWKQSKRHTHVSLQDTDWQQLVGEQADPMAPQHAAELVHHLLAKLPPRDRLVLTLRYLDQCSVSQTAQRTGWTPSLVKVQTHRAKHKLKKLLKNTDIEFEV